MKITLHFWLLHWISCFRWCCWLLGYLAGNKVDLEHWYFWNLYQPDDVKFILVGEWWWLCMNATLNEYARVKVKYGKPDVSSTSQGKSGWIDMHAEKNQLEPGKDHFVSIWTLELIQRNVVGWIDMHEEKNQLEPGKDHFASIWTLELIRRNVVCV